MSGLPAAPLAPVELMAEAVAVVMAPQAVLALPV
jgi:hypothetical protein